MRIRYWGRHQQVGIATSIVAPENVAGQTGVVVQLPS